MAQGLPYRHDERAHGCQRRDRGQRPAGVLQGDDPCAEIVDFLLQNRFSLYESESRIGHEPRLFASAEEVMAAYRDPSGTWPQQWANSVFGSRVVPDLEETT